MRARVVIGGVLLSVGILGIGIESAVAQQQAATSTGTSAAGSGDGTSAGTSSGSGTSGSSSGSSGTSGGSSSSGTSGSSGTGSSASTDSTLRDGTYTGTAVTTRFGNVQVRITIAGGKLTDVTALQLTDQDGRSVQISAQAAPVLRQEALTAQSAQIDSVSGATYTSEGYIQSLQSALDQAG